MTREDAKREMLFAKREVVADSWIDKAYDVAIKALSEPEIIRCWECKHNPRDTWFGCPMSHLNERQRPEDAWCFRGERRTRKRKEHRMENLMMEQAERGLEERDNL